MVAFMPRSGAVKASGAFTLAVVLLLWASGIHGYSDRILYCSPGSSAIVDGESSHLTENDRIFELDDLSARGTSFSIDGVTMSNVRGTNFILANTDLKWTLQTTDKEYGMRGILVRAETLGVLFTLDGDTPLKVATPCIGGTTAGVSHSEPSRKVKVTGTMRFDALGTAVFDVTVVYRNFFGVGIDNASVTGTSKFVAEIVNKLPPTTPRAPSRAPIRTSAPVCKAPTKAPLKAPAPVKVPTRATPVKVPVRTPVKVPTAPVKTPVKTPVAPVKKPVAPVKKPATPVKKPVAPVKKPVSVPVKASPVAVKTPVTPPVKPSAKFRRLGSKPDIQRRVRATEQGTDRDNDDVPVIPKPTPITSTCSD